MARGEPRLPAAVAVLLAIALYALLPDQLLLGPRLVVPALEVLLFVPLVVANPRRMTRESRHLRRLAIGLVLLIALANAVALMLLVRQLVLRVQPHRHHASIAAGQDADGHPVRVLPGSLSPGHLPRYQPAEMTCPAKLKSWTHPGHAATDRSPDVTSAGLASLARREAIDTSGGRFPGARRWEFQELHRHANGSGGGASGRQRQCGSWRS